MTHKALVIGINNYSFAPEHRKPPSLFGAVNDAKAIGALLQTHATRPADDDYPEHNWDVGFLTDETRCDPAGRTLGVKLADLERSLIATFTSARPDDHLLVYFAGHAVAQPDGPELITSEGLGYKFDALMRLVDTTDATSVTVILDCCVSGAIANESLGRSRAAHAFHEPFTLPRVVLREGLTVLTASREWQQSNELNYGGEVHGAFTQVLLHGLTGDAADIRGTITTVGLFAYAAGAFSAVKGQQPLLKAHIAEPVVLRKVRPQLSLKRLQKFTDMFPTDTSRILLSPAHEGGTFHVDQMTFNEPGASRQGNDYRDFDGTPEQNELDHLKEWRDSGLVRGQLKDDGRTPRDFWWCCLNGGYVELTEYGKSTRRVLASRLRTGP